MSKLLDRARALYNNLRLQSKFTITHLVITTIPMMVIFLFFHGKLYDMVLADTIRMEQTSSSATLPKIDRIISQVLDVQAELDKQPYYKSLFHRTGPSGEALESSPDLAGFCNKTRELADGRLIRKICIYLDIPETQGILTDPASSQIFRPVKEAQGTYWYGIFKGDRSYSSLFCPEFYLSPYEVEHYGELAYVTKTTLLYEQEYRNCYTAIYYSKKPLTALLTDNLTQDTSVAYIINDRDSTVATSSEAQAGIYHFDYDTVQDSFMNSNNFVLRHVLDEDVYAGFYHIKTADWYMVAVIPSRSIIFKSLLLLIGLLAIYLICILIALLIATRLSHSITNRISTVIGQMVKVRTAPPIALPASDIHDEVGSLIDTYNYMTREMNQLIKERARAEEELRIAEFNSLQAQINPHFLYNTMDMINWLAQQGRTGEVSEAVMNLSRFYKLTLSRKETVSTIADEIEHVSIYVHLQNMRFGQIIELVEDIPDNLKNCPIPKLTFQPVVENSILHGLLEKTPKGGTIVLTGWTEENAVVILISDDGVGIAPEKLKTILSGKGSGGKGTNIAIYNTHQRLQVLYGPEYGLSYRSAPGAGAEVEIRLPGRDSE